MECPTVNGETERSAASEQGFTLLELIIVIAIIGILATIAMPALKDVPRRANEAVLKTNLHTMRDVIDQYYGDKGKYPASLEELQEKGYLRKVPNDPMTKRNDTWVFVYEEAGEGEARPETEEMDAEPGITDVHSGSPLTALDGSAYSDW
jgi:general secretion pathway protein G